MDRVSIKDTESTLVDTPGPDRLGGAGRSYEVGRICKKRKILSMS